MSKPLDLARTLETLEQWRAGLTRLAERASALNRQWAQGHARADRQREVDLVGQQDQLNAQIAQETELSEGHRKRAENVYSLRRNRLAEAHKRTRENTFKNIANDEAKEVFRIQRELLQTSRELETGKNQADEALKAMQAALESELTLLEELRASAFQTFLAYPGFRAWLTQPADPAALPAGAHEQVLLETARSSRETAEQRLGQLRRGPLHALFRTLPFPFLAVLVVGACAAAVPLAQKSAHPLTWPAAGGICAGALVLLGLVYYLARRSARPAARDIASAVTRGTLLLQTSAHLAGQRHQQTHQDLASRAETRTALLQAQWEEAKQKAEGQRVDTQRRLEQKFIRASEHNADHHRRTLARVAQQLAARTQELRQAVEHRQAEANRQRDLVRAGALQKAEAEWAALAAEWKVSLTPLGQQLQASALATARDFPAWSETRWDAWTPPSEMMPAVPFGRLHVTPAEPAGVLAGDPRFPLPSDAPLEVPLLLTFPDQGSLVFETKEAGRDEVLAALNNLVLRLLAVAPPGRARFTVLDPVGLGQSFAGLMHLTDHEDRLVNRRIWTQPDHIEQRLGELNEHVEKVTQLYLRNEYATIAEYNLQAGRIAEPYQFLVVADFPSNFSDLAIRRLLSLVTSGPRCGIYLLVHRDLRKPTPSDFVADDLRKAGGLIRHENGAFVLANNPWPGARLTLDPPPDPDRATAFLQRVGRSSIESNRVEVPFEQIAPATSARWTLETTQELRVPIGRTGATKLQYFALGKGTRQHALIAGKTGSGKSTLLHVLVTNLALWCSPDQVEFYLVDFKKGVEFKCYGEHRLPHARVVAIESDREFGLSVLQRIDAELQRRGDLFRDVGAQDLAGYQRAGGTETLPRSLLIIDEFQELFTEDDRIAQNAALLLDRLVRQGRAFGIHVVLGSQTLGGAYTLARTTLGQMVVRIALQCNEADAMLIMSDDNPAPRLLSRPGEAIYNDSAGAIEGNSPFQVVWLADEERDAWLSQVQTLAAAWGKPVQAPVVFEGNMPAEVRDNLLLSALMHAPAITPPLAPRFWLGAPNAIKGPTEIALHRQSGHHVLMLGQNEESSLALLSIGCLTLAAQHPRGGARFLILDASPSGSPARTLLERTVAAIPHECRLLTPQSLGSELAALTAELDQRQAGDPGAGATVYFVVRDLQRFKALRFEEDFGFSSGGASEPAPGQLFNRLLSEGSQAGLHILCLVDTYNNATRFLNRRALAEFEIRVLFQMNPADSASLIDTPKASTLGLYRALLHHAHDGTLETFRPYALPELSWIDETGRQLHRLVG